MLAPLSLAACASPSVERFETSSFRPTRSPTTTRYLYSSSIGRASPRLATPTAPTSFGYIADSPATNASHHLSGSATQVAGIDRDNCLREASQKLAAGDIPAARSALAPAVRINDPEALAMLGRTYDPIEIAGMGGPGNAASAVRAASLYRTASRLGYKEAQPLLDRLNGSPHIKRSER